MEKEMYKPQVGYEMCGDKVFLVIPQGNYNERRLVMTKDLFIACYEHWIKKVEHNRQLAEKKIGRWMWSGDNYYCSECMYPAYEGTGEIMNRQWNYCPSCGAKMED